MRKRLEGAVAMVLLGLVLSGPAVAQVPEACGPFRVEWNRASLPTFEKLEGFVYNESRCSVADVRLKVVAVDAENHPVAESLGWVYGDIPAGGRGYFEVPLTTTPAADYRVTVISFDEVSRSVR